MSDQMQITSPVVPVAPVPSTVEEHVPLHVGGVLMGMVSPPLKEGYRAACTAYEEMWEHDENGPCLLLTGYQYAHLSRQYCPAGLSPLDKHEWQRGFIAGWNASQFGL